MEVGLVEARNNGKEHVLVSLSSPTAVEVRPVDLTAADGEQHEEPCGHFSIRGYVAQIRKREAKTCSPFSMFYELQSDENASMLPSLPVRNFRRWDCKSCLSRESASAQQAADGAFSARRSAKVDCSSTSFFGKTVVPFHAGGSKLLSCSQQLSKEKIVGSLVDRDSSNNGSSSKCCHSVSSGRREVTCVFTGPTVEGNLVSVGSDRYKGVQNQPSEKFIIVAKGEACKASVEGKRNEDPTLNAPETYFDEDILKSKPKEAEKDHKVVVDLDLTNNDLNYTTPKETDDQLLCKFSKTKEHCLSPVEESEKQLGLDNGMPNLHPKEVYEQETPAKDVGLPECTLQAENDTDEVDASDTKLHRKKAKKVRLLTDIINNEKLSTSRKVPKFCHDTEADQSEGSVTIKLHVSKWKDQNVNGTIDHASTNVQGKPFKRKKKYKSLEIEDDGSSLMYWFKRASKKLKAHKKEAKSRKIDALIVNSKPTGHSGAENDVYLNPKRGEAEKLKQKVIVRDLRNLMPRSHCGSQRDILAKRKTKLAIRRSSDGIQNFKNNANKTKLGRKTKKVCQDTNKESSHLNLSKASLDKCRLKNVSYPLQETVNKKQRVESTSKKKTLDDIPMDIVELLAKNQHERHLANGKAAFETNATSSTMPQVTKNSYVPNITEVDENKASPGVDIDIFLKNTVQSNSPTAVWTPGILDFDYSHGVGNQGTNFSRNELMSSTMGIYSSTCPNDKCLPQCSTWNQIGIQNPQSSHSNMEFSAQVNTSNGESSVPLHSILCGPKALELDTSFNHMKPLMNDFLCPTNSMSHSYAQLQHKKEEARFAVQKRPFSLLSSNLEEGNVCKPKMVRPPDLYTNESIPAMHLLRLMDWTKCSRSDFSPYGPSNENQIELLHRPPQYSNQCRGLISAEYGFEFYDHNQNQQNFHKPFRPLPRVGVLGSLLQKEISNCSDNCGTQTACRIGQFYTKAQKNSEGLRPVAYSPFTPNPQIPFSGHEDSEQRFGLVDSIAHVGCSSRRDNIADIGISNQRRAFQPLKSFSTTEICVINRNPADFTTVDENNEYMRGSGSTRPRHTIPSGNSHFAFQHRR
ncbi:uncharacterized protein LOC109716712 [Ananas comosus]|uniref:Uncharacterized protein LOC109716712 n=1 Tax=Ananas comosus TaxID=4615 RepID=A0A6P5FNG2_ANACO|nr:uncharacterized protein LOC109716712 [Ananas comosus]XP_020097850.1 uncharacterized protein LOC109716712 [Ananas comosus]XP_020097851.1 uncharacterized protein LOC109716712 [Ananas comosus]